MRRLARLGAGAAAVIAALSLTVTAAASVLITSASAPSGAAILVLGGRQIAGAPGPSTRARVDAAAALWRDGAAPLIVMTGGRPDPHLPATAGLMAARARAAGVPDRALRVEGKSHSTLQNALFARELAPRRQVILVSNRYHLPRAWASFRWAGYRDIRLAPTGPRGAEAALWRRADPWLEAVKWPVNLLRAAGASALIAAGVPPGRLHPLLA